MAEGPPTSQEISAQAEPLAVQRRSGADTLKKLNDISTDLQQSSAWADGIISGDAEYGGNTEQVRALLAHAKDIVVQLRTVMEHDYEIDFRETDGELPSYENLVSKLNTAFRHQKGINQMSSKLMSVNYMVSLSNFAKNRHLQQAVVRGRQQIMDLQQTVMTLEDTVDSLTVEVDVQRQTAERLKIVLDNTRTLLEYSMIEYRTELGRQREMIKKQSSVIGELYRTKFNQDLILDSTLFLFCLWAANTPVVDMPVRSAVDFAVRQVRWWWMSPVASETAKLSSMLWFRKRTIWTRQAAKLVIILLFMRKLRQGAADYGVHNKIGATYPYITTLFGAAYSSIADRVSNLPLITAPPKPSE